MQVAKYLIFCTKRRKNSKNTICTFKAALPFHDHPLDKQHQGLHQTWKHIASSQWG
jgi:hypothetical protein